MGHKLVLHIGTGKTGTTALQSFLWNNAGKLREYGWEYPDILKKWCENNNRDYIEGEKNGNLLKVSIIADWEEDKKIELWSIIKERLKYYDVILSDEAIWGHPAIDTRAAIEDFKKRFKEISIIVYLRRQDNYLESLWNQNVKERLETDNLFDFIHRNENWKSVEYLRKLKEIEKLVGKENLYVRVYEKGQFEGGDLFLDFLNTLGKIANRIPDNPDLLFPKNENERLNEKMLLLKLHFNRAYVNQFPKVDMTQQMKRGFSDIKTDFEKFFGDYSDNNTNNMNYSFLSIENRMALLDYFRKDNEIIANYYLNRDNGILFYDEGFSEKMSTECFTDREICIIEKLTAIIAFLCKS